MLSITKHGFVTSLYLEKGYVATDPKKKKPGQMTCPGFFFILKRGRLSYFIRLPILSQRIFLWSLLKGMNLSQEK